MALVVGVAGFLGSSLAERLLEKGIQVIGVDNFKTGHRRNLENAAKNEKFHLLEKNAQDLGLEVEKLDYLFIAANWGWDIKAVLKIFREISPRLLFISSIDLYSKDIEGEQLHWLRQTEEEIAKFAKEHNLNARILRLAAVYGPKMHFRSKDPMVKLIKKSLLDEISGGDSDFSTRALYIDDAIELLTKCIFAGSTALKIFDGSLMQPIKIDDVKQVLLDPIWHEEKNFRPQELPPWTSPNLAKTIRFLNWHPKAELVASLKATLSYFKDNEIPIDGEVRVEEKKIAWEVEKKEALASLKGNQPTKLEVKSSPKWASLPKMKFPKGAIVAFLLTLLVSYALFLPAVKMGWGILTFRAQLAEAAENLNKGQFDKGLENIALAEAGLEEAKLLFDSLDSLRQTGWFKDQFEMADQVSNLATLSVAAAKNAILGVEYLYDGLKSVTGELTAKSGEYFDQAKVELDRADADLEKAQAIIGDSEFQRKLPKALKGRIDSLSLRLNEYSKLIQNGRAISLLLPQIVAQEGTKSYLVLLQNNNELRPTGGFIGSFAKITFEGGKLKNLEVNDIYAIDGQLSFHVEPPKEIKEDLGQNNWYLRDSNWEPDFPTSAKQAEWFFNQETGQQVAGVVALDVSAMEKVLEALGPLDLTEYNEKISADNLFERAISHAELSFFPGSQGKKNFITSLANALFNKLFFVPQTNWPGVVAALGKGLEEKHISIFLNDPKLFSYLISQNWTSSLPRPKDQVDGQFMDFLAVVEANLGANKSNYYLQRKYRLETVIGKDGEAKNRLKITYLNTSPSDTWPAGKYKNRFRIYLPFGTKLTRAVLGEADLTRQFEGFVDFGRSGFSALVEIKPKEQKTLILDYELPTKITFKEGQANYKLDVIKQAGTLTDPFEWSLTYPLNYQLASDDSKEISPQEMTISTDLSTDRSFEVRFKK